MTDQDVARVVAASSTADDVERALADDGITFRSRRALKKFLERAWKRAHADEIERVRRDGDTEWRPIVIERAGVTFEIFGAAHGQRRFGRMRDPVKAALRNLLESAERLPDSDYATERGFTRILGLPEQKELRYSSELLRRAGIARTVREMLQVLLILPLLPVALLAMTLSRDPFSREIRACLHDPRRLPRAARLWELTRLPAAVRLDLEGSSFRQIHSEEIARAVLQLIDGSPLKSLTVLVGFAHADEIAHYITLGS